MQQVRVDRADDVPVADQDRWAEVVEEASRCIGNLDIVVIRMMAQLIRARAIADAYAAARLVCSFKMGIDDARDAAIDAIANAILSAAAARP